MDSLIDSDKLRFCPLNEKRNHMLWLILVRAAISSRGLRNVFGNTVAEDQLKFTERKQQARKNFVNALNDLALRVVRPFIGNCKDMLVKLDVR